MYVGSVAEIKTFLDSSQRRTFKHVWVNEREFYLYPNSNFKVNIEDRYEEEALVRLVPNNRSTYVDIEITTTKQASATVIKMFLATLFVIMFGLFILSPAWIGIGIFMGLFWAGMFKLAAWFGNEGNERDPVSAFKLYIKRLEQNSSEGEGDEHKTKSPEAQ